MEIGGGIRLIHRYTPENLVSDNNVAAVGGNHGNIRGAEKLILLILCFQDDLVFFFMFYLQALFLHDVPDDKAFTHTHTLCVPSQ